MEPTNKSSVTPEAKRGLDDTVIEFLPDADAIERIQTQLRKLRPEA